MKKEDIKSRIVKFINLIDTEMAEINIMLVDQNNQRKKRYKGHMMKTQLTI